MEENISKRPKSGKIIQLRPKTGRPKTALKINTNKENDYQKNLPTLETKVITESIDENKNENNIQSVNDQISEKTQFLEALGDEVDKETFNNILSNEVNRMKNINEKKVKLKNINLLEKKYNDLKNFDELYDWTNLFNNSRPISSYTTLKKPKLNIKEDKKTEEFKSPVILVDLFEDQMNMYFGNNFFRTDSTDNKVKNKILHNNKNITDNKKKLRTNNNINNTVSKKNYTKGTKINIKKSQNNNISSKTLNHNHIRPMSVYSPREKSCSFYFSSVFSDYYKEDLKTFSEKMKILKAKVKSNTNKLSNEIKTQRKIAYKKELILNRLLNMKEFNFGKENLIIAGQRRNPIPLLKSIFKQTYPDKEVMKENIKLYYNTMKPLGEKEGPVDYTQNERWRLSRAIATMREGAKDINYKDDRNWTNYNSFNNKKNKRINNLILSYYNNEDPYIKMFEKMAKSNKSFKEKKEINESNNTKCFNPILQTFNKDFSILNNKKYIEKKNINNIQVKSENNIEENKTNLNTDINNRPKTSYKSVGLNIRNPLVKRPLTSKINHYNIFYFNLNQDRKNSLPENYIDPNSNFDYISSNCLPLKTISNVGNVSYDKINQMIQERKYVKLKNDYFMTSTGQTKNSSKTPKPKYKEDKIILEKNNNIKNKILIENDKWNETFNKYKSNNKKNNINYYNFDNIIDKFIVKKKKAENFYTMKYFKNMGGKYYSSSNNVNVKNKRNNKIKILNNYYTEFKYSKDDQEKEFDFTDEAIFSQSNCS